MKEKMERHKLLKQQQAQNFQAKNEILRGKPATANQADMAALDPSLAGLEGMDLDRDNFQGVDVFGVQTVSNKALILV